PADAAALVRYLRKKKFAFNRIEMGEEPDGQQTTPEDYGALYIQVARAIKAVDPTIQLGGPGYQTVLPDWIHWPDAHGDRSWTSRFVKYMGRRGRMADFNFFTFEWYPFDDVCGDQAKQIAHHPKLLQDLVAQQYKDGLPKNIPMIITEYGYSSFAGQAEVEMPGAIVNSETAALFLTLGGNTSYYYGLEPNWVFQEEEGEKCDTSGNLMLLQFYDDAQIRPVAAFWAAQLINQRWVLPGKGKHTVLKAVSDLKTDDGDPKVTAYALLRPDGKLSILLFNKDPKKKLNVKLVGKGGTIKGPLSIYQYSGKQYRWEPADEEDNGGEPVRDLPPEKLSVAGSTPQVTLPPYSITVVQAPAGS
ncbi:MAG TPA: hypothetical protein VGO89_12965, partial [Streptomyces sp.]|nr:hypothetical protein [Streptomyces sp.]